MLAYHSHMYFAVLYCSLSRLILPLTLPSLSGPQPYSKVSSLPQRLTFKIVFL